MSLADIALYAYTHVAGEGGFDLAGIRRSVPGSTGSRRSRATSRSTPESELIRAVTIRVRFAPSPTGSLHLGNALTAVANRRFADAHGGPHVADRRH